jgi:integrase/recombinase XerD
MEFMFDNGVKRVEDVNKPLIWKYKAHRQELGKKGSTVDAHHRCLATFFKWLHDNDYRSDNPMVTVKKTKFDVEQKPIFSMEELWRLQASCETGLEKSFFFLMLDCGLRVNEAFNLKIKDVDLQGGFIHLWITKGRINRVVPIGTATCKELKRMLKARRKETTEDNYLFVNRSGKKFTRSGLSQLFKRVKKRAGVTTEGGLHGMRRTCLTTLVTNGTDLATIQKISGHRDVKTLIEWYLVIDKETMRNAIRENGAVNTLLLRK